VVPATVSRWTIDGVPTPHLVGAAWWTARILSSGRATRPQLLASYLAVPTGGAVSAGDMRAAERLLVNTGFAVEDPDGVAPTRRLCALAALDSEEFRRAFVVAVLCAAPPIWLGSAASAGRLREELIPLGAMAALIDLFPDDAVRGTVVAAAAWQRRREQLAEIGLKGECAVLDEIASLLRSRGREDLVGHVSHVSLLSDSFGYDIRTLTPDGRSLHIEVKTSGLRAPYRIHLTRHEAEVAASDDDWLLVICTVQPEKDVLVTGWCTWEELRESVPVDVHASGRWESAEIAIEVDRLSSIESIFGSCQ